jgi:predicted lactoylglutathione lyase
MQNNNKQIYINLIVKDLVKATTFYEAIEFVKNPMFSNEDATGLNWSENIYVMLLSGKFASNFIDGKEVVDPKKTVSAMYALNFNSKEEVDEFVEKVRVAGGRVYMNEYNASYEFMYGYEFEDLDGYIWEPYYMDMSKFPQN